MSSGRGARAVEHADAAGTDGRAGAAGTADRAGAAGAEGVGAGASRARRRSNPLERAFEGMGNTAAEVPYRWPQMLSLFVNFLVVISVILMLFTAAGMWAFRTGRASRDALTNPVVFIALVVVVAAVITFTVFAINQQFFVKPLRAMLAAMDELGHGNFNVRVEVEDRAASREITQFADNFNAAAEALGSLEVMRAGFVDDFSHEFKTPIVSINGFAQLLLEDDVSDSERHEYAQIIYDESRRLANMASDILLLRQAESTTMLGEREPVDVAEAVRRAAITMQGKWSEKGLAYELELDEASVMGSPVLLERAIVNLLDNACKFSPNGGSVRASLAVANEVPDAPLAEAVLAVENDGPAISPDALSHIFERFYQADPSHATQGAGLGLPLVARVAELHGGSISAESTSAGHTCFTFVLPLGCE